MRANYIPSLHRQDLWSRTQVFQVFVGDLQQQSLSFPVQNVLLYSAILIMKRGNTTDCSASTATSYTGHTLDHKIEQNMVNCLYSYTRP